MELINASEESKVLEECYTCPLIGLDIPEGDCYDINMVRIGAIKPIAIEPLKKELSINIDIKKSKDICINCKYKPF